jgi:hypothetical protein
MRLKLGWNCSKIFILCHKHPHPSARK